MSSSMLTKRKRNEISESNNEYQYDSSTPLSPRSGKWTRDEERYADKLIHDFELGLLPDCEEGATLRSYLAHKLNCAPMRISKKFAGKCIGKHVFSRRIGSDRMMYFYEQQQQMIKQARYDDGFVYNTYDLLRHSGGFPTFQYDDPAPSTSLVNSTLSSPSQSPSNQDEFDCFCYSPNELIVDEFTNSNDSTEADEWRDVLSFFSGEILEDQQKQQEHVLFLNKFPERVNSSPTFF